jgi:hypothetical protein
MGHAPLDTAADRMYPPSTGRWITHVVESAKQAMYIVHDIRESQHKLLVITSLDDSNDFALYRIHSYEAEILKMTHDLSAQNEIRKTLRKEIDLYSHLEDSPPSWSIIDRLVEEVNIPNLSLKSSMSETLDQLVPTSFPKSARRQIKVFLAWTENAEIPTEDPEDFIHRYLEYEIFNSLVTGHLKCFLDGIKPPPYVRIMAQANMGSLKVTERPTLIAVEENPWYLTRLKLYELFPDWMGRVLDFTDSLNKQGRITVKLPVSRNDAIKSKKSWGDRFALITQGSVMRGFVQRDILGLKTLVYVGAAHKWPHTHLDWSARLGYQAEKSPQIQMMVLPQSAIERVSRIMPSVHAIEWETNSTNLSLYNRTKSRWTINSTLILKSLERSRSIRQLANEFGKQPTKQRVTLTQEQAKILDMISWGLYLANLENKQYSNYSNIDNQTIKSVLEELHEQGVFKLFYLCTMQKLTSICISANGVPGPICSLSRAFLKHAPTSDVKIANRGKTCYIISRVPEDDAFKLITTLPSLAKEIGISLSARPISAYIGYRNNLYQRLLKDDGTWDDDVSGLVGQARLRPKDEE